jgi:hypothetical protein
VETCAFFLLLPRLGLPFSTLATGLNAQNNEWVFSFFIIGLAVVNVLVNRLSITAGRRRQQSRHIEQLEKIGQAFLDAPPGANRVAQVLQQHVPGMFAFANLE